VGAVESMAIYGLYKVTMDLAVCYELKSEFADVPLDVGLGAAVAKERR